ncbi:MAG: MFS transporter [Thermoproteota archaeon]|nr:MFS transporter [Thermoproteota archaeon]
MKWDSDGEANQDNSPSQKKDDNNDRGMRNVIALGVVSFFTDFSTEMVLGVLPLFVVSSLGASRAILGTIEGSSELTSYAFRMVSGSLSDRLGKRKIFVIAGYGLSTITKPFLAASSGWLDAFAVRFGDRMGKGLRTAPRDALIADSVHESRAGRAFGLHRTIDQLGAIVGPIVAFALLQFMDIRGIFLVSLIPGAIAVIILIFWVKEVAVKRTPSSLRKSMLANIRTVLKGNKPFVLLLTVTGLFGIGAFNFSFVLLRATDLGVSQSVVPLVYAVINVAHTVIAYPSGILADKIGKEKMLIVGYSVFALSSLLMLLLSGKSLYSYVIAVAFGVYTGISETMQRAVIPRYITSELRGTAFGLYNIVAGSAFFVANIIFGFLWDGFSLNSAISYSMITTVIAIAAMTVFVKKYSTSII